MDVQEMKKICKRGGYPTTINSKDILALIIALGIAQKRIVELESDQKHDKRINFSDTEEGND